MIYMQHRFNDYQTIQLAATCTSVVAWVRSNTSTKNANSILNPASILQKTQIIITYLKSQKFLFILCDLKDYNESKRSDHRVISTILGRNCVDFHLSQTGKLVTNMTQHQQMQASDKDDTLREQQTTFKNGDNLSYDI